MPSPYQQSALRHAGGGTLTLRDDSPRFIASAASATYLLPTAASVAHLGGACFEIASQSGTATVNSGSSTLATVSAGNVQAFAVVDGAWVALPARGATSSRSVANGTRSGTIASLRPAYNPGTPACDPLYQSPGGPVPTCEADLNWATTDPADKPFYTYCLQQRPVNTVGVDVVGGEEWQGLLWSFALAIAWLEDDPNLGFCPFQDYVDGPPSGTIDLCSVVWTLAPAETGQVITGKAVHIAGTSSTGTALWLDPGVGWRMRIQAWNGSAGVTIWEGIKTTGTTPAGDYVASTGSPPTITVVKGALSQDDDGVNFSCNYTCGYDNAANRPFGS